MAPSTLLAAALAIPALVAGLPTPQDDFSIAIVGGQPAAEGEFPYIVSLQQNGRHFCGGSLLDSTTVLTAAHCSQGNAASFTVRAGSLSKSSGGVSVPVSAITSHPQYNPSTTDFDYAVWKLSSPIPASNGISFATLPALDSDPAASASLTVAGWGALTQGGSSPDLLQQVTVPVVGRDACNAPAVYDGAITDNMFCAGLLGEGGKDSCQGDSGGPIRDDATGEVVGIVSWGFGCAAPEFPGVYSRIGASSGLDFIAPFLAASNESAVGASYTKMHKA